MAERGARSQGAAQGSALETRKAKDYGVTIHELLPEWKDRAAALGLTEAELVEVIGRVKAAHPTRGRRRRVGRP